MAIPLPLNINGLVNALNLRLAELDAKLSHSKEGVGSPEAVVEGVIGDTFRRTDGSTGTTFYVKESGTGKTGWIAK